MGLRDLVQMNGGCFEDNNLAEKKLDSFVLGALAVVERSSGDLGLPVPSWGFDGR